MTKRYDEVSFGVRKTMNVHVTTTFVIRVGYYLWHKSVLLITVNWEDEWNVKQNYYIGLRQVKRGRDERWTIWDWLV